MILNRQTMRLPVNRMNNSAWKFGRWLTQEDEYSDIIISSRIRLARNLRGYPFPNRATRDQLAEVLKKVKKACSECENLQETFIIKMEKLSKWDKRFWVERRLASPQFIENKRPSMLVVDHLESLSIMVNEEDHLRIQRMEAGLGIREAWRLIGSLDDELEEHLEYSYSNQFGYLTACPTNTGTGMRVSIFIHLPALSIKEQINSIIQELPTSEITVRGFYGEGTEPLGSIFQVSNQLTLGRTEEGVVDRLEMIAKKMVDLERKARTALLREDRIKLEDIVFRAVGVLNNARIMSSIESMKLLSNVRLGMDLGLIKNISHTSLNQLLVMVQPAHLQKFNKRVLNSRQRDEIRAEFIKQFYKFI